MELLEIATGKEENEKHRMLAGEFGETPRE